MHERLHGKKYLPLLIGAVTLTVFLINSRIIIYNIEKRIAEENRSQLLFKIGELRANLESALNTRLYIGYGLVSFISINNGITQEKFEQFAELLIKDQDPVIMNISILKGSIISFVYPYSSNKDALGKDLLTVPEQRDTVLQAIQTKKAVITGPVKLVQGGSGIISRIPVFIGDVYWGQVSVVLMHDELFNEAGFYDDSLLEIAIRDKESGRLIWGKQDLFSNASVIAEIALPVGSWEFAAKLSLAKDKMRSELTFYWLLWGSLSVLLGFLAMFLTRTQLLLDEKATHDYLTELPNRAYLIDHLNSAIDIAERHNEQMAVAMIDLDGFKQINDSFGHAAGDEVLKKLGERLLPQFRKSDVIARFGGDEFVVLLNNIGTGFNKDELIKKIKTMVAMPFYHKSAELRISASIGIALYPADGITSDKLLSAADARMYEDKRENIE